MIPEHKLVVERIIEEVRCSCPSCCAERKLDADPIEMAKTMPKAENPDHR